MNIRYAILGFLSWRSLTGYDLKKIFVDSPFIHWSGNNNQIYKSLIELHRAGLVTNKVEHQEKSPSRKVYTITDKGASELRRWILSSPELPQYKNTFLIHLAWADQLEPSELDALLDKYEHEIYMQLLMCQEQKKRRLVNPARTKREAYLWDMIAENRILAYESELAWVRTLRTGLSETSQVES
jgi:DNA-binding PadR family transcriptional regulator